MSPQNQTQKKSPDVGPSTGRQARVNDAYEYSPSSTYSLPESLDESRSGDNDSFSAHGEASAASSDTDTARQSANPPPQSIEQLRSENRRLRDLLRVATGTNARLMPDTPQEIADTPQSSATIRMMNDWIADHPIDPTTVDDDPLLPGPPGVLVGGPAHGKPLGGPAHGMLVGGPAHGMRVGGPAHGMLVRGFTYSMIVGGPLHGVLVGADGVPTHRPIADIDPLTVPDWAFPPVL